MKHIIVGTAGHIDHGKTSLVKALTGIDADRLKEEKQRGITIDIGFADLAVGDYRFGFVDVPGHERFVKNMLAGAHGIDLVMLVIAADEGVMPQTREHFDICKLLQIKNGLTVLTKIDMVDEELMELAKAEIADFVANSFLANAPIMPVSAKTGRGIDELKEALMQLASHTKPKQTDMVARLPIDRGFVIKGFGSVVTGTLTAGRIALTDEMELLPGNVRTRVRSLQVHGQSREEALAGQRTAVNIQGVSLEDVERGQVLLPAGRFSTTSMLDVKLELLPDAPRALTQRTRIRLHHDTSEIMARVVLLEGGELKPGGTQFAQLRLESPTFALPGDRFIIRSYSPQVTIGGGVVIDAQPKKHRLKDGKVVPFLSRLLAAEGDRNEQTAIFLELAGPQGLSRTQLTAYTGFSDEQLNAAIEQLRTKSRVLRHDQYLLARSAYEELKGNLLNLLKQFHKREPLQPGMGREEVRERLFSATALEIFKMVIEALVQEKLIVAERELLRLASHQISLSNADEEAKQKMETKFQTAGFQALTYEEVAREIKLDSNKLRKIFQLLINDHRLVKVAEFVFHKDAIDTLIARIREQKASNIKLDISTFKDLTGLSRKHAIPLLEYLDSMRITRRVGNDREIL